MLFAWITDPNAWLALGTLTLLEIVLGIDNIIFLSLVVAKLPTAQRAHARRLGLAGAILMLWHNLNTEFCAAVVVEVSYFL